MNWVTDGPDDTVSLIDATPLSLQLPTKTIAQKLFFDNRAEVVLPFFDFAWILPDRTGVLVLFKESSYTNPDGSDIFPKPNNAAIYNADGSLRFQLKLPAGTAADRIGGVHSGSMPEKFKDMMGVVIATHQEGYPEWVYAIDPSQPELIDVRQWVRW